MATSVATSLVEQVTASLQQSILRGDYGVGSKIPAERDLAHSAGVSVPVVREALARLRALGVVRTRQGSGTIVLGQSDSAFRMSSSQRPRDAHDLAQLFEFRADLESASAAHAAELALPADILELRRAFDTLERSLEGEAGVDADLEFHVAIARASHNRYRLQLTECLHVEMRDAIAIARDNTARRPGLPHSVHREHEEILRAIEEGDPRLAASAMKRHLMSATQRLALPRARPGSS